MDNKYKSVNAETYRNNLEKNQLVDFDKLLAEAQAEITFYNWCGSIYESYVGIFHIGIVGVFLFKIQPLRPDVDEWVWVVVGDLPPLYITCEDCPNAACALDGYIGAMQEWVDAAEKGNPVDNLAPVNIPANPENAKKLKSRLLMLDERILSLYQDDLNE